MHRFNGINPKVVLEGMGEKGAEMGTAEHLNLKSLGRQIATLARFPRSKVTRHAQIVIPHRDSHPSGRLFHF